MEECGEERKRIASGVVRVNRGGNVMAGEGD